MSLDTSEVLPDYWKVLCFFYAGKSKFSLVCRLKHQNSTDAIFSFTPASISTCLIHPLLYNHLKTVHGLCSSDITTNSSILLDCITVDLTQLSETVKRRLREICLMLKTNRDLITDKLIPPILYLGLHASHLPVVPTLESELSTVGMFHHSLIELAHNFSVFQQTIDMIDAYRCISKNMEIVDDEPNKFIYSTYLMFKPPRTCSLYDFFIAIFYCGLSKQNYTRFWQHICDAISFKRKSKLSEFILMCFAKNVFIHCEQLNDRLTRREACFEEFICIASLKSSLMCQNAYHGMLKQFSTNVFGATLSMDDAAKMGCALLVQYYFANRYRFHTKVPVFKNVQYKTDFPIEELLSPFFLIRNRQLPQMFLLDGCASHDFTTYAIHLFVSIFTLPAKYTLWYVFRGNALSDLLNHSDENFQLEIFESVNFILSLLQFDDTDCVKWAIALYNQVFVTNVQVALKISSHLNYNLVPLRLVNEESDKVVESFVVSVSMLLVQLIGIECDTGTDSLKMHIKKVYIKIIHQHPKIEPLVRLGRFVKLSKYCDMELLQSTLTLENFYIGCPEKLQHVKFRPIEPYSDNTLFVQFVQSARCLRGRNFGKKTMSMSELPKPRQSWLSIIPYPTRFIQCI